MKPETAAHAAQRRSFLERLDAVGLGAHAAALSARLVPAIGLRSRLADGPLPTGTSRVGGEPDLPPEVAWPTGAEGPLLFVMQVDLAEITAFDLEERLPSAGLLSVFSDRWAGDVRVLHHPAGVPLARRRWEPTFCGPFRECAVDVLPELHLPPRDSAFVEDIPWDDDGHDVYWDDVWLPWWDAMRPGSAGEAGIHQLLGYAVAENHEEQSLGERVLVGFDSDDRVGMQWGDVHAVWTLLREDDLANQRWERLRAAM